MVEIVCRQSSGDFGPESGGKVGGWGKHLSLKDYEKTFIFIEKHWFSLIPVKKALFVVNFLLFF